MINLKGTEQVKNELTGHAMLKNLISVTILPLTRCRYLQEEASPIIRAWPVCWTFANILRTIHTINAVPPVTPPPRAIPDRSA